MIIIYIIIHISLILWLIFVPYKRRREMEYLDRQYVAKKLDTRRSRYEPKQDLVFRRSSLAPSSVPRINPVRQMRHSVGVIMIPDGSSFLPIQEETKIMNMVELHDQDDEYYDQRNNIL
jgi:hypothetical protein